ncbi:MAG: ATP-binding cassette domain-containing protein, partial [Deferribacteraceae bacterium]|nr:ATP-binding cassette domain-containing protein [Deferribacteraceae bacterium]
MISFNVTKKYPNIDIRAAFDITNVGISVLFGVSGSGKTSIINMLAGLVTPTAGHIELCGRTLFDADKKINIAPEKRNIGYVFQDGRLFPHMNVRKNLLYAGRAKANDLDNIAKLLGIDNL